MTAARKRRREGAVLTEALIAIGTLTVLLFGVTFFHQMYAAKADTMQRARLQAWGGTRLECSGDKVSGEAQLAVAVPSPILSNAEGPPQRTIRSRASLACNIDPDQNEDVASVLGWALSEGTEDLSGVFSGVGSQMLSAFASLANPLNWF
jgi:hypothetical protein